MQRTILTLIITVLLVVTQSSAQQLTVRVIPPPQTPPDAVLYIAGNHLLAGGWDAGTIPLTKQSDSLWSITLALPKAYPFEFKITRGSWKAEAVYKPREIPENTTVTMNADTTITLRPIMWSDTGFVLEGGITGTVRYHEKLTGQGLTYARDLVVWLPPSYETDTLKRYPVLYMHDGKNIVDPNLSFSRYDWRVDEVSDSLIRTGAMKEIIIVGIYNTDDRNDEYDVTEKGRAYQSFVINVVKPLIDSTYRTLPDRANTATMGASMGGLVSFLMAWDHPDVFSMAGCLAPLFRDSLIQAVESYSGPDKNIRLYIDVGGLGIDLMLAPGCKKMIPVLEKKGFVQGTNLEWFHDPAAQHNERAWAKRVWRPLLFMFENQ